MIYGELTYCVACGCNDFRACKTEDGPCFWVETEPPLCSGCASRWPRRQDIDQLTRRVRETMEQLIAGTTPQGAMVWIVNGELWTP